MKLGHVAIDGTKIKANASKHKAMSYERMEKHEARLKAEVESLLARAEAVDAAEDELYGVGQQPSDLPAVLRRREARLAKIREVRAALKRDTAKARAAKLSQQADELRSKAAEPTVSPQQAEAYMTKAAQHDQQSAELDADDPDPPAGSTATCLATRRRRTRRARPNPTHSGTSPIRTAASWSGTGRSCRPTTRRSPSTRRTRSSWRRR